MEETNSVVEQPSELGIVKDLAGGNSIIGVILVVLILLGGKAGMKFWTNFTKGKHEEKMKALEHELEMKKLALEEKKIDKGV